MNSKKAKIMVTTMENMTDLRMPAMLLGASFNPVDNITFLTFSSFNVGMEMILEPLLILRMKFSLCN